MDPDTQPALRPPDGLEPNFINPPTLMVPVTATCVAVFILPTLFVISRLFTKSYISPGHHVEDWLCYFAWSGLITYTSILFYIEEYGFARHQWDLSITQFKHVLYYINILYCIYGPTTLAAKLSVLFQFKRIFNSGTRDAVYWVIIVSIIANVIVYTALFFSYVFQCWPRQRIWNTDIPGHCVNPTSSNLAAGILNLISDLEALLLPAWAIWHLRMPVKRKLAAYSIFSVGSIACIIGVVGIWLRVVVLENVDFTWLCTQAALLVIAEIAVVIIVGCMPVLPRLYFYLLHKIRGSNVPELQGDLPQRPEYTSDRKPQQGKLGSLGNSFAKYITPRGVMGWTTIGASRGSDDDRYQLSSYVEARHASQGSETNLDSSGQMGIWTTTVLQQQVVSHDKSTTSR